jgi:hypothetical protein
MDRLLIDRPEVIASQFSYPANSAFMQLNKLQSVHEIDKMAGFIRRNSFTQTQFEILDKYTNQLKIDIERKTEYKSRI